MCSLAPEPPVRIGAKAVLGRCVCGGGGACSVCTGATLALRPRGVLSRARAVQCMACVSNVGPDRRRGWRLSGWVCCVPTVRRPYHTQRLRVAECDATRGCRPAFVVLRVLPCLLLRCAPQLSDSHSRSL